MSAFACAAPWFPPWLDRLPRTGACDWGTFCSYCTWFPPSSTAFATFLPCSQHTSDVERFLLAGGQFRVAEAPWVARVPGRHMLRLLRPEGDDRPPTLPFFYVESRVGLYGVGLLPLFTLLGGAWPGGIERGA